MTSITLPSYAKINETLHVGEIMQNGLHNITTKMRRISLHDDIILEDNDTFIIDVVSENNIIIHDNLVEKAWHMMNSICGTKHTPRVTIKKRISIGAGLGGGSSNYATFVHAFVQYYNLETIFQERLPKIREQSQNDGSDILFFLQNINAAEIHGEEGILTPLENLHEKKDLIIVLPEFCTMTKYAYIQLDKVTASAEGATNSFDSFLSFPQYQPYTTLLQAFCDRISMCGSGSACYVYSEDIHDKISFVQALQSQNINFIETSFLST